MDFLKDQLCTRRWFRVFTLEDLWAREALAIEVDTSLPAVRVIRVLDRIAAVRGYPQYLRVDNGPEFISLALDAWAYRHGVQLVLIDPGRPVQNAHIESFHDKVRDEFLGGQGKTGHLSTRQNRPFPVSGSRPVSSTSSRRPYANRSALSFASCVGRT